MVRITASRVFQQQIGDIMTDLNHLLREWESRQQPTPSELDSLQARIAEQLADVASKPEPTLLVSRSTPSEPSKRASAIAVLAVLASLLAAVTVLWSGLRSDPSRPVDLAIASLPDGDFAASQSLFRELDSLFDRRWRWLSELNGQVHIETDEPATDPVTSSVSVRLTIVQRRIGESNWNVVWEASVLARSEEWVRLPVELAGDNGVSLWTYSLPDGSTLVESDLTLTAPVPLRVSEQHVFGESGQPAKLWSARRSDGEFQLIQSVARWETNHG